MRIKLRNGKTLVIRETGIFVIIAWLRQFWFSLRENTRKAICWPVHQFVLSQKGLTTVQQFYPLVKNDKELVWMHYGSVVIFASAVFITFFFVPVSLWWLILPVYIVGGIIYYSVLRKRVNWFLMLVHYFFAAGAGFILGMLFVILYQWLF